MEETNLNPTAAAAQTLDFALKALQFGALGLGALVVVLTFFIIAIHAMMSRPIPDGSKNIYFYFMLLGAFSTAIAFVGLIAEKILPSRANVAVAFSPNFQTLNIPTPEIRYGSEHHLENHAFLIHDSGTIIITVDATFDAYRKLQRTVEAARQNAEITAQVIKDADKTIASTIDVINNQKARLENLNGQAMTSGVTHVEPSQLDHLSKETNSSIQSLDAVRNSLRTLPRIEMLAR